MLRINCFRQVRTWATTNTVLQSTSESTPQTVLEPVGTPQTVLELAKMLRDPNGNLRCPFGTDFEEQKLYEKSHGWQSQNSLLVGIDGITQRRLSFWHPNRPKPALHL